MKPTNEQFEAFQKLFNYFNEHLFNNELPNIILNFSRQAGTAGFFVPNHWKNSNGKKTHEISINPNTFGQGKVYIISTLVHEMAHLWQQEFGEPGAKGYHNREWANKMISIGLIPSDTGQEGGKQIGCKMSDYVETGGVLERLIDELPSEIWLPFETMEILTIEQLQDALELEDDPVKIEEIEEKIKEIETANKKVKSKYKCGGCGVSVWGKGNLNLICEDCEMKFVEMIVQNMVD